MSILSLSIVRSPEHGSVGNYQAEGSGVTVGRGTNCNWVLPDPRRSMSRTHCRLELMGGAWHVRDLSANGTFVNGASGPIGNECLHSLRQGDRLRMGDYEIEVHLLQDMAPDERPFFGAQEDPNDALGAARRPGIFAGVRLPGLDDPSPAFHPAVSDGRPMPPSPGFGAAPDHSPAFSDAFVPSPAFAAPVAPATPAAEAPDDWYRSMLMPSKKRPEIQTAVPSVVAPPSDPSPYAPQSQGQAWPLHETPPEPVESAVAAAPSSVPATGVHKTADAAASALETLLRASGLPVERLSLATQDPEQMLRQAGAIVQLAVAGLRALLIARGLVKREFRIEQTVLRPKENNPLKFAASDEQALAALLDSGTEGLKAVQQAITDLTEHEMAVMSATQVAARAMVEGLSPSLLEAEDPGGGVLPGALEKRLWAAYKRRHAKLIAQLEDDFDSAFGTAFARAYEEAINSGAKL